MDTNIDSSLEQAETECASSIDPAGPAQITTGPTDVLHGDKGAGDDSNHQDGDDKILVHPGLAWIADPSGERRMIAKSPCHDVTWVVDLDVEDGIKLWRAFTTNAFFDLAKVPADLIGKFADHQEAARQAERADFQVFRRLAFGQGKYAELSGGVTFEEAAYAGDAAPFALAASFLEGKTRDLKKNANGSWTLAFTIDQDVPQWLLSAPLNQAVKIGLVSLGQDADVDSVEARKRIDNILHRAQLRPVDPAFQEWLMHRYDRWGLMAAAAKKNSGQLEEATAETIRRICGVPSRADFRINRDGLQRFEAIDREFYIDQASTMRLWSPAGWFEHQ